MEANKAQPGDSRRAHERFCANDNRAVSLGAFVFCALLVIISIRSLNRPYSWSYGLAVLLIGHLGAAFFVAELMIIFKCARERLVLGLILTTIIVGFLFELHLSYAAGYFSFARAFTLFLWIMAAVGSMASVFSSFSKARKDRDR
jgi:hypothetical protein